MSEDLRTANEAATIEALRALIRLWNDPWASGEYPTAVRGALMGVIQLVRHGAPPEDLPRRPEKD